MAGLAPLKLFPTAQRLAEAIGKLMGGEGDMARLIPGMMTIQAFERRLYGELTGPGKTAGEFLRSLTLAHVLRALYGEASAAGAFAKASRFPGFLDAMLELFDKLGAGLVTPAELKKITGYSSAKEPEILAIYAAYQERLSDLGAEDSAMAHGKLVREISAAGRIPFLEKYASIELEDIYQFTPYRFELFRALARTYPVKIIAPVPDSRRGAFGFLSGNLAKFEDLGSEAGGLEIEFTQSAPGPLDVVKRRIFDMDPARHTNENEEFPPVSILSCSSRYREMEEVGREILRLKRKTGFAWSDFIVLFRETAHYAAIVEDVFGRYSIPFFIKKGIPLSHTPLARAALSCFVAIDSNLAREDVLRVISSSYFSRFDGLDRSAAGKLFLQAGIIDGPPEKWRESLSSAVNRANKADKAVGAPIAEAVMELLGRLARLKAAGGAAEFLGKFMELMDWLGLQAPPALGGLMGRKVQFRDNHSHQLIMETLQEALREARQSGLKGSGLDYGSLRDILLTAIAGRSMPEPGAADQNRVQALNAFDVMGVEARVVFICGLHEGEFPQRGRAGSILTDMEKERFNLRHFEEAIRGVSELRKGRRVFDSPSDKWNEESLLFFQAIRAAQEKLRLSYCVQELDGSPLLRSLFVDDMLDALLPGKSGGEKEAFIRTAQSLAISGDAELADPEEANMKLLRDIFRGQNPREELETRISALAGGKGWRDKFKRLVFLASMERGRDAYFAELDPDKKAALGGAYSGDVSAAGELLKKILIERGGGRYSPTALETYGRCPFRYFAGHMLGLKPEREPDLALEAKDSGTVTHNIAECFYSRLIREGGIPLKNAQFEKDVLISCADEVMRKLRAEGFLPEEAVWEPERERMMAMLERWMAGEALDQAANGFLPAATEVEFDFTWKKEGVFEPFLIQTPCQGARFLSGKIDRIDVNREESAIRVVDYKSGADKTKYSKLLERESLGRTSFQQPIYALLSERWVVDRNLLDKVDKALASYRLFAQADPDAAYVTAGAGGKRGDFFDRDFLGSGPGAESRMGSFENLTIQMILRLEEGRYPIDPESCEYCEYAGLCRYIAAPKGGMEE